ncbi:MAG TPA: DUF1127 domain-containing protein [Microvirga sp.]|nr:DUF1127 domain-containing protein [Microvirga sp.]
MLELRGIIGGLVREAVLYLAASPDSYLRQRAALRELDDRLLADIGLNRSDIRKMRTGFWTSLRIRLASREPTSASARTPPSSLRSPVARSRRSLRAA